MHFLLSLAWFALLMLATIAFTHGSLINAAVLAVLALAAAYASRRYTDQGRTVDIHHQERFNHYRHDPIHIYHREDGR